MVSEAEICPFSILESMPDDTPDAVARSVSERSRLRRIERIFKPSARSRLRPAEGAFDPVVRSAPPSAPGGVFVPAGIAGP